MNYYDAIVYIIEDDPEFGAYLQELLEDTGVREVCLFRDGLVGLNASLSDTPDLLVLDLNLPSLRGEEICRLLRSSPHHQSIRILVCSDMPEAQRHELELLKIGADLYFEKPFVEQAFIDDVIRLLTAPNRGTEHLSFGERDSGVFLSSVMGEDLPADDRTPSAAFVRRQYAILKGTTFSGYEILEVLGGGAVGTVYKAHHRTLDRMVALKVFLRSDQDSPEQIRRFQREARIMAHLNHPNIVQVYDTGQTGYTYYIGMELMEQGSLLDVLQKRQLTWDLTREIIDQAAQALIYLHQAGIIHRDLKPGNILCTRNSVFKVGDFGISRARLPLEKSEFTRHETVMGTKTYMAPEMMMGKQADALTDQYAFGRTILRLFEGPEPNVPPVPLNKLRPDCPPKLSDALNRFMHVDPEKRYASMEEAREAALAAF